ncbi:putative GAG-pre-integrase domain-containing protein [Rosa chinensis]|uniref:Putative GAG-pre-integrase domain-containing protein n=1 Tax=Rosa chinensis TaxID=74649 RepID=A0A2P6S699_ROSCH|nr:putative GAG-pre-integrase domain-containing protein [Rosa chinensis]
MCDDYEGVYFNKDNCVVLDNVGKSIMGGKRSKDNCFCIHANETNMSQVCMKVKTTSDILELWHQRLGHINFQDLVKLSSKEGVRGLPKLSGQTDIVCEGCKLGKQIRSSHRVINEITTSQPLDLMHMDLVGPIQKESIGEQGFD